MIYSCGGNMVGPPTRDINPPVNYKTNFACKYFLIGPALMLVSYFLIDVPFALFSSSEPSRLLVDRAWLLGIFAAVELISFPEGIKSWIVTGSVSPRLSFVSIDSISHSLP